MSCETNDASGADAAISPAPAAKGANMKRIPAILFGAWGAVWLCCEALAPAVPPWMWPTLFAAFLPIELWGALRQGEGDTLSEGVWAFLRAGWARTAIGVALALALATRFASIPWLLAEATLSPWEAIPWGFLSAGLGAWLVVHFAALGRHG